MRQLLFLLFLLAPLMVQAANPAFGDFDSDHFATNGNKVYIKSWPTNQTFQAARRNEWTADGVDFFDDFERLNTPLGILRYAPSFNRRTATNHWWYPHPAFLTHTNYYITNGVLTATDSATAVANWAVYPTVDTGYKPTYFGAKLRMIPTGIAGADQVPAFVFVSGPNTNDINLAYHFAFFPGFWINVGFWNVTGSDILFNYVPPNWQPPNYYEEFTYAVRIYEDWAFFHVSGAVFAVQDPRFKTYGGRYMTYETYNNGGGTGDPIYTIEVLSVWAGDNTVDVPVGYTYTNGLVSIGTNEPHALLHLKPATSGSNYVRIDHTDGSKRFQFGVSPLISSYAALWMGDVDANSPNNATLVSDGLDTTLLGSSTVALKTGVSGGVSWGVNSSGEWFPNQNGLYNVGRTNLRVATLYNYTNVTDTGIFTNRIGLGTNAPVADFSAHSINPNAILRLNSPHKASIFEVDTNGNVGIGTNNPVTALDVNGAIKIQGPGVSFSFAPFLTNKADGELHVGRIDTTSTYAAFGSGSDGTGVSINGTGGYLFNQSATSAGFSSSTAKAKITSGAVGRLDLATNVYVSGNVGIGTNAPTAPLHVVQATAAGLSARFDDTNFTPRFQFGTFPGAPSIATIWLGNITPSDLNYAIAGTGGSTLLNSTTTVAVRVNNSDQWTFDTAKFYPNTDNTEFLGDSTHRIARIDVGTAGITNAGVYQTTSTGSASLPAFGSGSSGLYFNTAGGQMFFAAGGVYRGMIAASSLWSVPQASTISWESGGAATASDVSIYRSAAGRVAITNGLDIPLGGGLKIGNGGVTVTNILTGTASLDFAAQTLGATPEDLPITVTGAADGDAVRLGIPVVSTTNIIGSYFGFASNGVVFVRFVSTGTAQNPSSGTFRAIVTKLQ